MSRNADHAAPTDRAGNIGFEAGNIFIRLAQKVYSIAIGIIRCRTCPNYPDAGVWRSQRVDGDGRIGVYAAGCGRGCWVDQQVVIQEW